MNSNTNDQKQQSSRADGGMFGGALLGMLAGFSCAGPHIHEWPIIKTALIVVGLCVAGGVLGYVAMLTIFSFTPSRPKIEPVLDDFTDSDVHRHQEPHLSGHSSDSYVSDGGGYGGGE